MEGGHGELWARLSNKMGVPIGADAVVFLAVLAHDGSKEKHKLDSPPMIFVFSGAHREVLDQS